MRFHRLSTVFLLAVFLTFPLHAQSWRELFDQANQNYRNKNYDSALVLGKQALDQGVKEFGAIDSAVAITYHRLGLFYSKTGPQDSSLICFERADQVWERAKNTSLVEHAKTLNNLGTIYRAMAHYEKAEPCILRALAIKRKYLPLNDSSLVTTLTSLGSFYIDIGAPEKGINPLNEALQIAEKNFGKSTPRANEVHVNLGALYKSIGENEQAAYHFNAVLQLAEKIRDTATIAGQLNNLGAIYRITGRYKEAERILRRAVSVMQNPKFYHAMLAMFAYSNLGSVEYELSMKDSSKVHLLHSIDLGQEVFRGQHPDVAMSMQTLATIYRKEGQYARADSLFRKVLELRIRTLGPQHPLIATSLEGLATTFRSAGQHDSALATYEMAYRIYGSDFKKFSRYLNEHQALKTSSEMRSCADMYISTLEDTKLKQCELPSDAVEILAASKGAVSDEIFQRNQSIIQEKNASIVALAERYQRAKGKLSTTYLAMQQSALSEARQREVDSLQMIVRNLESDLMSRSASFRATNPSGTTTSAAILAALPKTSGMVEYVRYNYWQPGNDTVVPKYAAVVFAGGKSPRIVFLGTADRIDKIVSGYRTHFLHVSAVGPTNSDKLAYDRIGKELYNLVWQPLEEYVSPATTLFIAPDGQLDLVSFAGLIGGDGKFLIENHPIHYLSAGRDLLRFSEKGKPGKGLLALGDPDFDATSDVVLAAGLDIVFSGHAPADPYSMEILRSSCDLFKNLKVGRLPSTRHEVAAIGENWRTAFANEPREVLTGADANEGRFKKDARGKRVLHIATHGYFLGGACTSASDSGRANDVNPLLLSGLLLAGANNRENEEKKTEDGILTALEVTGLDLFGTQFVVLSACETGLGEIEQGEGVYGLRRAFQMAGVRTVVSALWQVPDAETTAWMKSLYARQAASYPELMQRVALERIRQLKLRGKPIHPFTWGAFVGTGDWRMK